MLILPPHRVNSEKVATLLEFNVACRFIYHSNHLTIKAKGWHPVISSAPAVLVSLFSCDLAVAGVPAVLAGVPAVLAGVPSALAGVPALLASVPLVAGLPPCCCRRRACFCWRTCCSSLS